MLVDHVHRRAIWTDKNRDVFILDQTKLPYEISFMPLRNVAECATAIVTMQVRGAPLIGAAGGYGLYLAMREDTSDQSLELAYQQLLTTRPTAVNLYYALQFVKSELEKVVPEQRAAYAFQLAEKIADEDVENNQRLGNFAADAMESLWVTKGKPDVLNVLTHCNAGWLATVDWGTALSGVYQLQSRGIPVHVWVDETRPRNQGARLTAWELVQQGIDHTVIADNVGGHLMQHGLVDCCIVGTDRTTRSGDVCNKIGTYLKALSAYDNEVPFYVAAPASSIDWSITDGLSAIPIEERPQDEVIKMEGIDQAGNIVTVNILSNGSKTKNFAFDVTPAKYITALFTERGRCEASEKGLASLFSEKMTEIL